MGTRNRRRRPVVPSPEPGGSGGIGMGRPRRWFGSRPPRGGGGGGSSRPSPPPPVAKGGRRRVGTAPARPAVGLESGWRDRLGVGRRRGGVGW